MEFYKFIGNLEKNFLYLPKSMRKYIPDIKYYADENLLKNPNTVYGISLPYIKDNSRVLDVGCSIGYVGKFLKKKKNCSVYGIDISRRNIEHIKKEGFYDKAICIDLDNDEDRSKLKTEDLKKFDYILCLDVIEHLKNINDVLFFLFDLLNEDGSLIISVPNVNHIDIVYNLIFGRFNYSLVGILDNTHLRFFTEKSFIEWIENISIDLPFSIKIKLIGKTYSNFFFEGNTNYADKLKAIKLLNKLYKIAGTEKDMFTVQNIFMLKKVKK